LIAAAIGVVQEFWPLFVGVAVLGAAAYAIRRSIYKKPTWKCPKCNVTMPLSDVQDTGGAGHCPMCAHVALYPEPRGMCPYCGTGGVAYKAKICHKCHKAFL